MGRSLGGDPVLLGAIVLGRQPADVSHLPPLTAIVLESALVPQRSSRAGDTAATDTPANRNHRRLPARRPIRTAPVRNRRAAWAGTHRDLPNQNRGLRSPCVTAAVEVSYK